MADKKDYYETLGVAKDADADEIKSSYRKLARQYHPDVTKEDPKHAEERFKEISEAYEVLADPEKWKSSMTSTAMRAFRAKFSQEGNFSWQDFSHGQDLNDIFGDMSGSPFSNIFEAFFGGGQQRGPRQGQHLRMDIEIDLEEAAKGVKREDDRAHIREVRPVQRHRVQGRQDPHLSDLRRKGPGPARRPAGQQPVHDRGHLSQAAAASTSTEYPCPKCDGEGYIRKPQKIEFEYSRGVDIRHEAPGAGLGRHFRTAAYRATCSSLSTWPSTSYTNGKGRTC